MFNVGFGKNLINSKDLKWDGADVEDHLLFI